MLDSHGKLDRGLEGIIAQAIQGFMELMRKHGLSMHQIHALMYIFHAGECQVADIGSLGEASKAAASQLVERLVQQGLVDRKEDPSNRRIKKLRLSEKGRELISESFTSNHFLMKKIASLTPDQQKTIHAALTILMDSDQPMEEIPRKEGKNA